MSIVNMTIWHRTAYIEIELLHMNFLLTLKSWVIIIES